MLAACGSGGSTHSSSSGYIASNSLSHSASRAIPAYPNSNLDTHAVNFQPRSDTDSNAYPAHYYPEDPCSHPTAGLELHNLQQ